MKILCFHKQTGFTLIELLISVSIITILATISLSILRNQSGHARDARRKADLEQMRTALEFYRKSNQNTYPNTNGEWRGVCGSYSTNVGSDGFIPGLTPDFIPQLPSDPRTLTDNQANIPGCTAAQTCYLYRSDATQTDYKLLAHCTIEDTIDPDDPLYDPCRPTWALQVSSNPRVTNNCSSGW